MASIGGDFAFEGYEPLSPFAVGVSDADATQRLPAADRTLTDLVPVHEEVAAWIAEALEDAQESR